MGVYLRREWYHFRKQIERKRYKRPLKIRKGQECYLSERIKKAEDEIIALHFGFQYSGRQNPIRISDYACQYLISKQHKNLSILTGKDLIES